MHPRERLPFSAIETRAPLKLPDGLRLIVWPLLALEEWDMSRPMARMVISPPQGVPMLPDHPNWSWHEYGMRVGFWRLKRMFHDLGISPTVTLNARVCETYPQVARACAEAGWELNAHGFDQVPMHKLEDQKAVIDKSVDIISKFWGKKPRGWFGLMSVRSRVSRSTRDSPRYCELEYSVRLSVVSIALTKPSPPQVRNQSSFSTPQEK